MSQIPFKTRAQSGGGSIDEASIVRQFLSGSSDYRLSVAICYASTGITTAVPSDLGQSFTATNSDVSKRLSQSETPTTQIEVSNVRYRQHGLDVEFKFRASELSFRWPNWGATGEKIKRRTLRFYLQITLVPTSSLQGRDPIYLLRTGWYKIKEVEKIYSTGNVSGIDAQITAIPWVYEFNEPMKICYSDYAPAYMGNDNTPNLPGFLNSPARIFYYQKIMHDRRRTTSIDYSEGTVNYEEDAPSGYRGVFFRESDNSPQTLISDLPRIMCPSCEETALTLYARLLTFKGALKPDAYGNPADGTTSTSEVPNQKIIDHPVLAWRDLTELVTSPEAYREKWYNPSYDLDFFDSTLDSDSVLITECAKRYIFKKYNGRVKKSNTANATTNQNITVREFTGLIEAEVSLASYSENSDASMTDIVLTNSTLNQGFWFLNSADSTVAPSDVAPFSINKDMVAYYRILSETAFNSSITGIQIKFVSISMTMVEMDIDYSIALDVEREILTLDFGGLGYQTVDIDTSATDYAYLVYTFSPDSVMCGYSSFIRKIQFSAEWRPWITIYDVVRVAYKDDFGLDTSAYVFIQDIDANADSLSATYVGYIFEDILTISKQLVRGTIPSDIAILDFIMSVSGTTALEEGVPVMEGTSVTISGELSAYTLGSPIPLPIPAPDRVKISEARLVFESSGETFMDLKNYISSNEQALNEVTFTMPDDSLILYIYCEAFE